MGNKLRRTLARVALAALLIGGPIGVTYVVTHVIASDTAYVVTTHDGRTLHRGDLVTITDVEWMYYGATDAHTVEVYRYVHLVGDPLRREYRRWDAATLGVVISVAHV